mmetsp:Transcript_57782/g.151986  ORF Transcript_57782/g.151986 Transcript_57782/m.151986 type:complete len:209 (+) Transcript_57782:4478-5104(+)
MAPQWQIAASLPKPATTTSTVFVALSAPPWTSTSTLRFLEGSETASPVLEGPSMAGGSHAGGSPAPGSGARTLGTLGGLDGGANPASAFGAAGPDAAAGGAYSISVFEGGRSIAYWMLPAASKVSKRQPDLDAFRCISAEKLAGLAAKAAAAAGCGAPPVNSCDILRLMIFCRCWDTSCSSAYWSVPACSMPMSLEVVRTTQLCGIMP